MNPQAKLVAFGVAAFVAVVLLFGSVYVVDPGERGIVVTLGKVSAVQAEGLGFKWPLISSLVRASVQQHTEEIKTICFSSNLQQVHAQVKVLYRVPEASIVSMYKDFSGAPFENLVSPRVIEALKEATSTETAEDIVKKREVIKARTLENTKKKLGDLVSVVDVVVEDVSLSPELEASIEAKMVQEQEAAKAKFTQQKVGIEAETAVLRAEGEAKAIDIRGKAIQANPQVIQLQMVEKWDGKSPLVVGSSANVMLPLERK